MPFSSTVTEAEVRNSGPDKGINFNFSQVALLTGDHTVSKLGPWCAVCLLQILPTKVGFIVLGVAMDTTEDSVCDPDE